MSDHDYNGNAFDEWLRSAAREYREPPAPDRDAVWRGIQSARQHVHAAGRERPHGHDDPGVWPPREHSYGRNGSGSRLRWGLGIAAALALAFGIGRWAAPAADRAPDGVSVAPAGDYRDAGQPVPGPVNYDLVTAEHLGRTEALLVIFRTAPRGQGVDPEVARWAGDLLSTTRLIMDWSESADPRLARLLTDLELVLARIVQLPVSSDGGERAWVERSIESAGVLPRLRAMLPPPRRVGA